MKWKYTYVASFLEEKEKKDVASNLTRAILEYSKGTIILQGVIEP